MLAQQLDRAFRPPDAEGAAAASAPIRRCCPGGVAVTAAQLLRREPWQQPDSVFRGRERRIVIADQPVRTDEIPAGHDLDHDPAAGSAATVASWCPASRIA